MLGGFVGWAVVYGSQCYEVTDALRVVQPLLQLHDEPRVVSLVGQGVVCEVALLFRPAAGHRPRDGDEHCSRG